MLLTVVAFFVALAILIAVHEYGHYRVAVACGVKVLRFSIGFGMPLLRWRRQGSPTEFVIGAFPLLWADRNGVRKADQPLRDATRSWVNGPIVKAISLSCAPSKWTSREKSSDRLVSAPIARATDSNRPQEAVLPSVMVHSR